MNTLVCSLPCHEHIGVRERLLPIRESVRDASIIIIIRMRVFGLGQELEGVAA